MWPLFVICCRLEYVGNAERQKRPVKFDIVFLSILIDSIKVKLDVIRYKILDTSTAVELEKRLRDRVA